MQAVPLMVGFPLTQAVRFAMIRTYDFALALLRSYAFLAGTKREQVLRHRGEARVDHLVVHREEEHVVEEPLEVVPGFAVDVPLLALRRGVGLRLERRRAKKFNCSKVVPEWAKPTCRKTGSPAITGTP